jgi:hypothetical protein
VTVTRNVYSCFWLTYLWRRIAAQNQPRVVCSEVVALEKFASEQLKTGWIDEPTEDIALLGPRLYEEANAG